MNKPEALKLALEALERISTADDDCDFLNVSQAVQLGETIDAIKQALEQPVQEPDGCRHIREQDCLLDVDEKAWWSLVENRGGCRCHISPPCGACSNPISEEELNEVGYTYTTPPAAQPAPVSNETMQKLREKLESPSYTHALAYQNIREALEIVMRWIDDYCETGPENDFEKVEKIANAALEATPPAAQPAPVPLTERELELIDGMIEVQLDHAKRCDSIANRTMAERQKGWDMERVALLQKIRATPPAAPVPLTDDQIRGLTPKPDGVAEGNVRRVEVLPGVMGTEFDEVDAWSMPLVLQIARAIEAHHGITEKGD